ncbi:MAG TPA: beta-propeller domain-containing protein [Acidimicrobiales bacterium]|nr:beta-propeller domain-containing protein [Acidimicrobiales bacterium]
MEEGTVSGAGAVRSRALFSLFALAGLLVPGWGLGRPSSSSAPASLTVAPTVDVPDLVKSDGQVMVVLRQQPVGVQVVDVSTNPPQLGGFISLPQLGTPYGLFLVGQDAVVLGSQLVATPTAGGGTTSETATYVSVVNVADEDLPSLARTYSFPGQLLGARLISGQVVLALDREPTYSVLCPGICAAQGATADQPAETLTVASFDPTESSPAGEVTISGSASYVYASATSMFLAASQSSLWPCPVAMSASTAIIACCPGGAGVMCPAPAPGTPVTSLVEGALTTIYGFDLSDPAHPAFLGTGRVPGTLVGPEAMSEYDGYLRVVSDRQQALPVPLMARAARGTAQPVPVSANTLTVLQPENGSLVEVGQPLSFAPAARVCSVLFQGSAAYVSTAQLDGSLYALDLGDPDAPKVAGELANMPCLTQLQPVGNGLLAGLGRPASNASSDQLQLDVFSTSTGGPPSLAARQVFGASVTSPAESDSDALMWWAAGGLLVLPADDYASQPSSSYAAVFSVSAAGNLSRLATLRQPTSASISGPTLPQSSYGSPEIERALVEASFLLTVSQEGVMANDVTSLAEVAWLPFASGTT